MEQNVLNHLQGHCFQLEVVCLNGWSSDSILETVGGKANSSSNINGSFVCINDLGA